MEQNVNTSAQVKGQSNNFWHESRNTVKGFAITTVIGVAGFGIKSLISLWCKSSERNAGRKDRREFAKSKNAEDLKVYEEKLKLRKKYGFEDCQCYQCYRDFSDFTPIKPKIYNPFSPIEAHEDSRLFASAIHKGDVGVVVAAKGVGKTTLFMQIADKIARGESTGLWPQYDEGSHDPQKVLYYDGELTETDMFNRYYRYSYDFSDNVERYNKSSFHSIDDVLHDVEGKVATGYISSDATVVIDNVTKLMETSQVDKIKKFNDRIDAIHAQAEAKGIKLTIISIIHVRSKEYPEGKPIRLKDAAGGSDLINFGNFVIALERPKKEKGVLLVKILNARGEPEPDKVCVLKRMDDAPCLRFEYCGEMDEKDALAGTGMLTGQKEPSKQEKQLEQAQEIKTYIDSGHTQDEAAARFNVSRQTIINRLKLLNP